MAQGSSNTAFPPSAASATHQVTPSSVQAQLAQGSAGDHVDPQEAQVISLEEEPSVDEAFDPCTSRCSGPPIKCRHGAGERELVDGFGLCSQVGGALFREAGCAQAQNWTTCSVQKALREFMLSELDDTRKAAFALASGHLKVSPFSDSSLGRLSKSLADLLPDPELALERTPGQPFWLHLLHQSLVILGDPYAAILVDGDCSFAEGVHLGDEFPIARTPQVYRKRVNFRALDVTEFEPDMANYSSAELSADQLEEQFRRDERAAAVEAEFGPGRLLVAAMGAVAKPNGEVRPLHDATHGIGLNNKIRVLDKLEVPGPDELLEVAALGRDSREAVFAISADISQAHRRVKVRRADWPKLGCRSTSSSRTIWLNLVGTFGVSSAAFWWARLFGLVGRWVLRSMLTLWNLQLLYVDDLHLLTAGPDKFLTLWMILAAYEVVGTPFAYHKFKGGVEVIGYHESYSSWSAGVSDSRARWVISWVNNAEEAKWVVVGRTVIELTGRLTFVARILTW